MGLVIASGLARGIDASAHKGALASATGATIGVLGCGIDVVYPKENKKIFEEIEQRGALISEFPAGHVSRRPEFPDPQPHHRGDGARRSRRRGSTVLRITDHGAAGDGIWPRSLWRSRQCDADPPASARTSSSSREPSSSTSWEDVVEELPTPVRAELMPVESVSHDERAALIEEGLDAP